MIAVPLGILAGSSKIVQAAINPIVQMFRPVSPLAWLPIVTLIVSAVYVTSGTPMFQKIVPDLGDHRHAVFAVDRR